VNSDVKAKQQIDPYNVGIGGVRLDPYIIAEAFGLPPTIAEALKKLLRLGRKHKTAREDAEECIKTVRRWLEIQDVLEREDGNNKAGTITLRPASRRCDSCAPEFGCWDGGERCQKLPLEKP
jgi:hypothetical protein